MLFPEVNESPEKTVKKQLTSGGPSGSNRQPFPPPKPLQQNKVNVNVSVPSVQVPGGTPNVAISQVWRLST